MRRRDVTFNFRKPGRMQRMGAGIFLILSKGRLYGTCSATGLMSADGRFATLRGHSRFGADADAAIGVTPRCSMAGVT
jgi:hypothetical protein